MKIVSTIEARMTSKRLPGKVLLPANGKPLLAYLTERLKAVPSIDEIVLATTVNNMDDVLIDLARELNISFYRGSEDNVMQRVMEAAESANADIIVEITGDCPLIDPMIVEQAIQLYQFNQCDYVNNVDIRGFPIGMAVQVFSLDVLRKSYSMTTNPLDYEHVTRHIRLNPDIFSHIYLPAAIDQYWPELEVTLDEKEDYFLIKKIIEFFGIEQSYFSCAELIKMLKEKHPEWVQINQKVRRKDLNNNLVELCSYDKY